jgi:hypothetical protein
MSPSAVLIGLLTLLTALEPQSASAQIRAVYIQGPGDTDSRLLHDDPLYANCLWFATYILHEPSTTPSDTTRPRVTLSFFTEEDWSTLVVGARRDPTSLEPREARVRTRVLLGSDKEAPRTQVRKAEGLGAFKGLGELTGYAEQYLAGLAIPTRLDSEGQPTIGIPRPPRTSEADRWIESFFSACPRAP